MNIRPVTASDIPLLSEFWYDQMALRLQKQATLRFAPRAQDEWQDYARGLLESGTVFLLAESDNEIAGCVIGQISSNRAGILPRQVGVIESVILDLHSPHRRGTIVSDLFTAVRDEFRQLEISHIIVTVPTYAPVEQAFWRGLGLRQVEDTFWIEI